METTDGSLVGNGTDNPIGFTVPELDKIFFNTKVFTVSGGLPGQVSAVTRLVNYPSDGNRAHMFMSPFDHKCDSVLDVEHSIFKPSLEITRAFGAARYFYDGKYYPYLRLEFTGVDGDGLFWSYVTGDTGKPSVGQLTLLGKTASIYPIGDESPEGDVSVTVNQAWVI